MALFIGGDAVNKGFVKWDGERWAKADAPQAAKDDGCLPPQPRTTCPYCGAEDEAVLDLADMERVGCRACDRVERLADVRIYIEGLARQWGALADRLGRGPAEKPRCEAESAPQCGLKEMTNHYLRVRRDHCLSMERDIARAVEVLRGNGIDADPDYSATCHTTDGVQLELRLRNGRPPIDFIKGVLPQAICLRD